MAFKKGYTPWNKGRVGDIPWNKGINYSEEMKKNMSKFGKENNFYGRKHKETTKIIIGKSKLKFYKEHPETINKIKEARAKQIFPIKDTGIEIKIQNYLKQLNINFFAHQYIKDIEHGYQCDILIPVQEGVIKKTIIECFGNYWHKYPQGREVDIQRCNELREQGWRVLVFWENEIKVMELNDLKGVITR
jgi:G:T-mismatch repair DNA endonuclease (very short patch repair protein)